MNPRKLIRIVPALLFSLIIASLLILPASSPLSSFDRMPILDVVPENCSLPVDKAWVDQVRSIKWVTYSSPNPTVGKGFYQPTADTIYKDLRTLKKAGFTGLITYGSVAIMGKEFPAIAQSLGYEGIILGVWDPRNEVELKHAKNASELPITLGYTIGNEGLSERRDRYLVADLCSAISELRTSTGKPVATSEAIDTYYRRPKLLLAGDWVFANVHPYWHSTKYPLAAIQWEEDQYAALLEKTDQFIFFKEVGLPSSGAYGLSEENQDVYYRGLAETNVQFAYFEGFDQPSKAHAAVEPYWGIFRSDLSPKLLASNLMGYQTFTLDDASNSWVLVCSKSSGTDCSVLDTGTLLLAGDELNGSQYRSLLSFNTADIPDGAIVTSVKLRLKSAGVKGADPLEDNHRNLLADICQEPNGRTFPLQMDKYRAGMNCNNNLGASTRTPNDGWYTMEFDSTGFESINLTGMTQFRLRIGGVVNKDMLRSYITFHNGEAVGANKPVLIIRYNLP